MAMSATVKRLVSVVGASVSAAGVWVGSCVIVWLMQ